MPEWLTILIAIVGALGGRELLAAWITQRARRKITAAEANKTEAEAGLTAAAAGEKTLEGVFKLVTKLETNQSRLEERINCQDTIIARQSEEIDQQNQTITAYAERITYLIRGLAILFQQFQDAGITPCWKPDDWIPPEGTRGAYHEPDTQPRPPKKT